MAQTILEARMFNENEYGFNYFCLKDFNYSSVQIEQIVENNGIECYEFNTLCNNIHNIFSKNDALKNENIALSYFKYSDGRLKFFSSRGEDITNKIPNSLLLEVKAPTHNKIYRHRYIISENLVVVRLGTIGINPDSNMDVVKDEIYTKESFLNKYGVLPEKSFSFSKLYV